MSHDDIYFSEDSLHGNYAYQSSESSESDDVEQFFVELQEDIRAVCVDDENTDEEEQ